MGGGETRAKDFPERCQGTLNRTLLTSPGTGPRRLGGKLASARAGSCLQGCLWPFGGQGLGRKLCPNIRSFSWAPDVMVTVQPIRNVLAAADSCRGVGVGVQQVGMPLQVWEDLTRESSTLPAPKLLPRGEGTQLRGWGPSSASLAPLLSMPEGPDGIPPNEPRPQHPVSAEAPSLLPRGPCRKSILKMVNVPRSR